MMLALASGCAKPNGETLSQVLTRDTKARTETVEQLDINTRQGRPGPSSVVGASVIKKFDQEAQLKAFDEAIRSSVDGLRFASHPVVTGDYVLRVTVGAATWFIFCRVNELDGKRVSVFYEGARGETDINRMLPRESPALADWIDRNTLQAR